MTEEIDEIRASVIHICMNGLNWSLLQSFAAVYETGTLTAAAQRLGLTQPSLGRHVAQLEQQLNATLFETYARRKIPTQLAHELAQEVAQMQTYAARVQIKAEGQEQILGGVVRITASDVVASYLLPGAIGELMADNPGLELEIVATNSTENLLLREADIALRMHEPDQDDLIVTKLGDTQMGLFAHETYIARMGMPDAWPAFKDHIMLGYDQNPLMMQVLTRLGIDASSSDFRLRMDDQSAHIEYLRAGLGIVATQRLVAQAIGGVVEISANLELPSLPIYLTAHRELRHTPRIRRVYDALVQHFRTLLKVG